MCKQEELHSPTSQKTKVKKKVLDIEFSLKVCENFKLQNSE